MVLAADIVILLNPSTSWLNFGWNALLTAAHSA